MFKGELLIAGRLLGPSSDGPEDEIVVYSPYDGERVGAAPIASLAQGREAVAAAVGAFSSWRYSSRRERQTLLRRVATLVRERNDELAHLLTLEVGKPVTWSHGEVARLAVTFDLAADLCSSYGGEWMPVDFDVRGEAYRCLSERVPIGPVMAIVPYNWPYNLAAHKLAPALAVGCTVVLKASHQAPLSTLALARLVHEAGCPAGVLNAIYCPSSVAESLTQEPGIAMVSFTGSPSVGWRLKALLPTKKVSLELGGDATAIVCADADLDFAVARCVSGGYGYAGQVCIAVQHVLAHASVYGPFRTALAQATAACITGDPRDPATVCGPLISSQAADKVMVWIEEAVNAGATVLAGGTRTGNVVAPTLIEGVPPGTKLGCEEVFGPILTLAPYKRLDEAISRVNSSRFGIQCGVFTCDLRIAERAFRDLHVGGVVVGDYPTLRFDNMPYGGVKESGFGREGVRYAMDEMTEPKVLLAKVN